MKSSVIRTRLKALTLGFLILSQNNNSLYAGGWPFRKQAPAQQAVAPTVRYVRPTEAIAPSPMLGTFAPNQTMWVRGNGMVGGGYTPLDQDERDTLSLYGPFAAGRAQMKPVRMIQPTGFGGAVPVAEGDAVAYPNFPWKDSLPNLSAQGRQVRPRSPMIYPGWNTDSDTIDQH